MTIILSDGKKAELSSDGSLLYKDTLASLYLYNSNPLINNLGSLSIAIDPLTATKSLPSLAFPPDFVMFSNPAVIIPKPTVEEQMSKVHEELAKLNQANSELRKECRELREENMQLKKKHTRSKTKSKSNADLLKKQQEIDDLQIRMNGVEAELNIKKELR